MKHILVPIGSTENASNTLQYAIDFASEIGAKVFVFRAYKVLSKAGTIINVDDIIERETNLYLRSVISLVDTKSVDVKMISAKGDVIDSIQTVDKELGIDLIVVGPKSNSVNKEVFLGSTTGSIVKHTNIPTLVIPNGLNFSSFKTALIAFKSGVITKKDALDPIEAILQNFKTVVDLLLVKTPNHTEEDLVLDAKLSALQNSLSISENDTTFEGVLEYFESNTTDLLCVFKRKRGFFKKLWESNTILKSEFDCDVPLLVLNGLSGDQ
ncbi:MAG: universal stress protein [Flavobacteriaceae bacterium]